MPITDEIRLSPKCFKNMKNLKIFVNVNGRFVGKVKHYPNQLRLLDWPKCPLEYLPSGFDMKEMLQLNMPNSRIRRLGGVFKSMQNLTSLKLSGCKFLTQIPDMSGSPNLEFLDLSFCSSLEEVHPSVGSLEKLVTLNLFKCCNLVKLPPEVNWRSLQILILNFCSKLESFPEIVGEMKCMTSLTLQCTGIKTLPSSIRYLINLTQLIFHHCENLTDIPRSIYELQKLKDFELVECPKLITFPTKGTSTIEDIIVNMPTTDEIRLSPKCFKNMKNLKIFVNVSGRFVGKVKHYPNQLRLLDWPECPLEHLSSGFDMKEMLQLNMPNSRIRRLGGVFKSMQNLTSLKLSGCKFLTQIPDMSGSPNLEFLDLSLCSSLEEVHPSVGYLEKLVKLNLFSCCNLVKLPPEVNWRSLQELNLNFCSKLESFPEIVGEMKCMTSLRLLSTGIKTLPSSIRYLINLKRLSLSGCRDLTDIPRSIYELQKLMNFGLVECPKLITFPTKVDSHEYCDYIPGCNSSKIDFMWSTLVYLNLSGWPFVTLPERIKELVNLSTLILRRCTRLVEIPELPPLITWLDASDCVSLERISKLSNILERKEPQMIRYLNLSNCWRLCQNLLAEMAASKEDDDLFSRLLSSQLSEFSIIFPVPRSKILKWFSCQMNFMEHRRFEFWIEALPNFKWDNNTGLALCVTLDRGLVSYWRWDLRIHINEAEVFCSQEPQYVDSRESDDVWVRYIPFTELRLNTYPLSPFICRVAFLSYYASGTFKTCGVHLIMPPNEDVCMRLLRPFH
ncbi:PREDICTED: protein SUPPRESSOR OF npr1-1, CONSTITUTIVE 1-like [Fragaria vesca subsp. vesca]